MSDVIISIIIPVYNVQDYIIACLDSIATQTYTTGVECILVDDRGSDDSMKIVQEYLNNYKGDIDFRIITHERNRGLSAARNTGIMDAKGKYILFVDSDDSISAQCLMYFMQVALKYPEAQMIAAGAKTSKRKSYTMEKPFPDYADNPKWIATMMLSRGGRRGIPVTAWNRLVRKDFLLEHHLFFREGTVHEDELWNFILAPKITRIAFCKHDTYFYRIRPQSIMTRFKNNDERALACIPVWKEMLSLITKELEREQTECLWNFINDIRPTCIDNVVRKETWGILWQLVKKKIWPTSYLIVLYMMPFFFYIKFIRNLIPKISRINANRYDCYIS
ncbi:MAG: glycosyltransferase [Bacteroidaceae bacterium]|nr:glycosyltransferase [Bacteroidaceae bacterium]